MTISLTRPRPADPAADPQDRHRLTVLGGLAGLSLDALASVAYGPEAIVLVLAAAGAVGLGFMLPVTAAIVLLLLVLTVSYRQVIAAFPAGGGAYGVAKRYLGRRASLVAAAALIVDYVLNVAVSITAGVAALTSAVPALLPYTVWLCLAVLALVTGLNLRGVAHSARAFMLPTAVYVGALTVMIVLGLFRHDPAAVLGHPAAPVTLETVGLLVLLRAFANGCAALTGVEAIANAVPSFRRPRVRRAQHTEVALGAVLGILLIGIAVLVSRFDIRPRDGATVLAQVSAAALGHGVAFYVVQVATMILLGLAANTSFGGMPVLAQLLARDNVLPHLFALKAERQTHRYGIGFLAAVSAVLLVTSRGDMNTLVPLFAIGVFVGFTLSQVGMVRHWLADRPPRWRGKAATNGLGALLTGVAAIVVTAAKFTEGAWLVAVALPLLVLGFEWVRRSYDRIGRRLRLGAVPDRPVVRARPAIVPVAGVDQLAAEAVCAARSLSTEVYAVHVCDPDDPADAERLRLAWDRWQPAVPLVELAPSRGRRIADPVVTYLERFRGLQPFVVIGEVEPDHPWQRILQNQRGALLARAIRRRGDAVVCRLRYRLTD